MFRGPNASGVSEAKNLPVEFGPDKNVIWKTALPAGHSSPFISGNRIYPDSCGRREAVSYFVSSARAARFSGEGKCRARASRSLHKSNSAASPSIATDGTQCIRASSPISASSRTARMAKSDGVCRWDLSITRSGWARLPCLPTEGDPGLRFGDWIIRHRCRSEGREAVIWRKERPEMTRGFSTPVLQRADGRMQAMVAGTGRLIAYDVDTGEEVGTCADLRGR